MKRKEAQQAVIATAMAYFNRGPLVQYDQLSMDRMLHITTRHREKAAPEEATRQRTMYLDCSSYFWTVYYNTFGYEMAARLTWEMMELKDICVFSHTNSQEMTGEQRREMSSDLKALLQPGDGIVYKKSDNGHIMLYAGDGNILHCTQDGKPGSYNYAEGRNQHRAGGAIVMEPLATILEPGSNDLFSPEVIGFAVLRPLNRVGELTENALARWSGCRDILCAAEVSHPGGRGAAVGMEVIYRVSLTNRAEVSREVVVRFEAAADTALKSEGSVKRVVSPGETGEISFCVRIQQGEGDWLAPPQISANGLVLRAPRVLLGTVLTGEGEEALCEAFLREKNKGTCLEQAIAAAYGQLGIKFPANAETWMSSLFYRYDSAVGDVLYRKPQLPKKDRCIYSLFGGFGVITPETGCDDGIRATQITAGDFRIGDVILCSDDAHFQRVYGCVCLGNCFAGRFFADGPVCMMEGEKLEEFLDSLFGRFAFVGMRPCLQH